MRDLAVVRLPVDHACIWFVLFFCLLCCCRAFTTIFCSGCKFVRELYVCLSFLDRSCPIFPSMFIWISSSFHRACLAVPPPIHIPLPRLRPHHVPYALIRRVEDPLVEFRGDLDAVQWIIGPASTPSYFVFPHGNYVLAAFVAAAAPPAHGL